ncbi:MAG TPA: VanZ family protein [Nocardioides sp.]|nr:VanZ family protein [Nocardioides sp.]
MTPLVSDHVANALIASAAGTVVAVLLLIPTAAYQYRLDGRLQPRDLAILLSSAIYGLALWTYTLLPMPAAHGYRCKGRQLDPFATIRGIADRPGAGLAGLAHDPAFLQVALNVLLFVPLGFYVRWILHRGFVVTTLLGLGTSLLIETTQGTGVWHLYPCAYRLFDVDDLIVNTVGALLGALLAAAFVRRDRVPIVLPSSITLGRRLVGMVCDVLFVGLTGAAAAVAYRAWVLYGPGGQLDREAQHLLQVLVPGVVEAGLVLLAGRTFGEWVISVRAVSARPALAPLARIAKLCLGIGPMLVLVAISGAWTTWALLGWGVVTVAAVVPTQQHRGLAHVLSGMRLEISGARG